MFWIRDFNKEGMKCLILNYNRVTLPVKMADWCAKHGLVPIFIDNCSDYPPLLEYYKNSSYQVVRLEKRIWGSKFVWSEGILDKLKIVGNYIVTDPDLDLSGVPADFLSVMEAGLKKYPSFTKCGLSLEINDITNENIYFQGKTIKGWESQYWSNSLDPLYFNAPVDTTFAMYKVRHFRYEALRINRPYTAKHVPWYYIDIKSLPEDEQYYIETASRTFHMFDLIKKG